MPWPTSRTILVALLDPRDIVRNLHHAYRDPRFKTARYAVLVTGPSATADIDGVLIQGGAGCPQSNHNAGASPGPGSRQRIVAPPPARLRNTCVLRSLNARRRRTTATSDVNFVDDWAGSFTCVRPSVSPTRARLTAQSTYPKAKRKSDRPWPNPSMPHR
jgi:hypothetical protein